MSLADSGPADAKKLALMHALLQRDVTEVRMFLDHLERYAASIGPAQRLAPEVAAALGAIEADHRTRDRYLEFARDADEATVQTRRMALARTLGWLSPAQEQAEFLRLIAGRMARGNLSKTEVDLVCATQQGQEPGLAPQLLATRSVRPGNVTHSAALACMGSAEAHTRTVRALTASIDEDVAIAQVYLRHRQLANVGELRAVTAGIGRMTAGGAQVRALETLARQRLADPQSLQEIAGLFPLARSLDAQRAIAGILIRSDTQMLARADLARSLRQHRLKSPNGNDVIDMLIRMLQSTQSESLIHGHRIEAVQTQRRCRSTQVSSTSPPSRCHQFAALKISTSLQPAKPCASTQPRMRGMSMTPSPIMPRSFNKSVVGVSQSQT